MRQTNSNTVEFHPELHEILSCFRAERRTNEESNKRTKSEPTNSSSSTSSSSKRQSSSSERRKNGADEEVRRKKKRDGNNDKSKGKTRRNDFDSNITLIPLSLSFSSTHCPITFHLFLMLHLDLDFTKAK